MQGSFPSKLARTRAVQGASFKTRKQRRQERAAQPELTERQEYWRAVSSFVRADNASRKRAIRLSSGSAYGAQHRAVAFKIGK